MLLRCRGGMLAASLLGLLVAACGPATPTGSINGPGRADRSSGQTREPRGQAMPHTVCIEGTGGSDVVPVDVNGDGRPDMRTLQRNGRPYCRETDANFDGRVDIVRFFDEQGRTARVEDDYDFDGRIDAVATYTDGQLSSDVLDTNFDGLSDTWRDYRNGHILELRRDANSDGRVDLWEHYNAEGRLESTQVDRDGDGEPDPVTRDGGAAAPASSDAASSAAPASGPDASSAASPQPATQAVTADASAGSNS